MALTNYPQGMSSFGIPVVGSGNSILMSNKNYWFVSSALGSNGYTGTSIDQPFATLAYALSQANLAANDTIIVLDGHTETVATAGGLTCSVAGVDIQGPGGVAAPPVITFTTATTATFKITGAGVTVSGIKFVNGIASLVTMLDIQAKGVVIQNNWFTDNGTLTGLSFIDFVNASANAADGTKILNNYFNTPTAGNYNHAIGLNTVQDNLEVGGNYIYGNFALSGIHNVTGKVVTNVNVHDNYVRNLTASKPALNFISAVTGQAYRNIFESGANTPSAAIFGTALDASGNNVGNNGILNAGADFWLVKKGVVSSTITQAGVDLTLPSVGGDIAVKDVIVKTAATGLATGTNFQITSDNSNGIAVFFAETVANLGANKSIDMTGASVAKIRTTLESGKKFKLSSTGADCTGAGTIDIHILCSRLTAGANVALV